MQIRPAERTDSERVATLAEESFRSSYSLSPDEIDTIVRSEFAVDTLADRLEDPTSMMFVAEHDEGGSETVQGLVDVRTEPERTITWLHVDPQARGEGIGSALLERVSEMGDGPLSARILEDAAEGGEFLERFGLERGDNQHREIGGLDFAVVEFREGDGTDDPNEPSVAVPDTVTVEGSERTLERDEPVPGRDAPFFPIYSDRDGTEPYGYFCSQCASTDVSADGLERLECGNCGNLHRADQWDDAYL